jgi:hypothetical protein
MGNVPTPASSKENSSPRQLHQALEHKENEDVAEAWRCSFCFEHTDDIKTSITACDDIMQYSNKTLYDMDHLFRFCPVAYPPNDNGLERLGKDIQDAAAEQSGTELKTFSVKKNSKTNKQQLWILRCKQACIFKGKRIVLLQHKLI